jgi:PKD domain
MQRHLARRRTLGRTFLALLPVFATVLTLGVSPASGVVVHDRSGRLLGLLPRAVPARQAFASRGAAAPVDLHYHGGPVLHSSAPYLVFWDPADQLSPRFRSLLARYFSDVARASGAGDNVYAVARQFTDPTGFADDRQSFDPTTQAIADQQPYPLSGCRSRTSRTPTCLTDEQVRSELTRLIATDGLPTGIGSNAPVYFVLLPTPVDVCASGMGCASNNFCGYHSYLTRSGTPVLFAVLPTINLSAEENPKDCQWDGGKTLEEPNGTPTDLILSTLSHEDSEAITDPLFNAWYAGDDTEDGDMCAATGVFNPLGGTSPMAFLPLVGGSAAAGTAYSQVIGGDPYYLQSEWSNGVGGCAMRPGAATLSPRFTAVPDGRVGGGSVVALDPTATLSSDGYSSVTWSFGDGSSPVFRVLSGAPDPVSHRFPQPGTYAVSETVINRDGTLATATEQVSIGAGRASASAPRVGASARRHPGPPRLLRRGRRAERSTHGAPRVRHRRAHRPRR